MSVTTIIVLTIVALALVIGVGILVFSLMRRSQDVIPSTSDRRAAQKDQVVALDDQGRPVTESQDGPPEAPRDAGGFEDVLAEGLKDLHRGGEE